MAVNRSPWSVKGVDPEAREAAKIAARRAGLTVGSWLTQTIRAAATEQLSGSKQDNPAAKQNGEQEAPSQQYNTGQQYNPGQQYNQGQQYNPSQGYNSGQQYAPGQQTIKDQTMAVIADTTQACSSRPNKLEDLVNNLQQTTVLGRHHYRHQPFRLCLKVFRH